MLPRINEFEADRANRIVCQKTYCPLAEQSNAKLTRNR